MNYTEFLSSASYNGDPSFRPFVKMHGLQNYFVIFDQRKLASDFSANDIIRICAPHTGVGAEQLLTIELPSKAAQLQGADAAMRIFNIDGQEVDACGNATRCIAHLLMEESGKDTLRLETGAGILECYRADASLISVILGPISTDWEKIGAKQAFDPFNLPLQSGPLTDGTALFIGNPHVVFFTEQLDLETITRYAPAVQNAPLFPQGVNVGVAEVLDDATLKLAVWERPGILTRACGTGACIAVYAAKMRGLINAPTVSVHLPGGTMKIQIREDNTALMTGPVAFCCHGFIQTELSADRK